jgi:hydrogenase maturation protease
MTRPSVLVAGIGNIFLGDDGFGVEVASRWLGTRAPVEGVKVADFGIRGVHLAYELLDGYDTLILIDVVSRGEAPGTVYVIEHEPDGEPADGPVVDAHSLDPAAVLVMLAGLGGSVGRVLVVGCEPATLEEGIGLSPPVAAAVDHGVAMVDELLEEVLVPV